MCIVNMKDTLILQDKSYISARRVQELFGYTSDYVGQLCRAGKLDCQIVGRSWFVTEKSIINHKSSMNESLKNKSREKRRYAKKFYNANIQNLGKEESPVLLLSSPIHIDEPILESPREIVLPAPLKYEFENAPFIPILQKQIAFVPASFSAKNIPSSVSEYLSINTPKISSSNLKYILLMAILIFVSSFSFSSSSKIKNILSKRFNEVSNFAVRLITSESSKVAVEVPSQSQTQRFNGIAVVPSSHSEEQDEIMKQKIRDSFSDEIMIKPDKSGTAGVITPVFKKAKGDDFVYVLVPVKN
ncbi:MAG: hypothetical protein AAB637_01630 [Patescibacteria group bacterium]